MVASLIAQAISTKTRISLTYKGTLRIVDPYLIGVNRKGNQALRAYQVAGHSSSGGLPAWRLFLFTDIEDVELLDVTFEIEPTYNPQDKDMLQVHYRV